MPAPSPDRRKTGRGPRSFASGFQPPDTLRGRTLYLDPIADGKAEWTEVPAGTGYERLREQVRQPTVPDISTEYVETATIDIDERVVLSAFELLPGETVSGVTIWSYVSVPSGVTLRVAVFTPIGQATAMVTAVPAGTTGWVGHTVTVPLSQSQTNISVGYDLSVAGGGTCRVYACYAEVFTATNIWASANAKLMKNRSLTTGLSLGVGWLGFDCFTSCDLGGGRSLFVIRDGHWATAAGQKQIFTTNPGFPAAPNASFARNAVATFDSYDVDEANFESYVGASPGVTDYFPTTTFQGVTCIRWPQGCFVRNGRLFVVGMLETSGVKPIGRWVAYTDSFAGTPDTWTWTYVATYNRGVSVGAQGIWDNSATDGFVYMFDDDRLLTSTSPTSFYRIPVAQFDAATDWRGGEWFNGASWSRDRPGSALPLGRRGGQRWRGNTYNFAFPDEKGSEEGSIHRRPDGRFQLTNVFDAPWLFGPVVQLGNLPYHMGYALTPGTSLAQFEVPTDNWQVPPTEDWVYSGFCHPQLTWEGAGPNDQVWTYNGNVDGRGSNAFDTSYWPKFLKATVVT